MLWDSERFARLVSVRRAGFDSSGLGLCLMRDFEICAVAARAGSLCLALVMSAAFVRANAKVAGKHRHYFGIAMAQDEGRPRRTEKRHFACKFFGLKLQTKLYPPYARTMRQ